MNEVQSNKSKILVVEDDPITSLVIEKFLNSEFIIEHVLSGEAALEKVKQNSYDLILMDIGLNGKQLDGIQTLNLIRNIDGYKNIPIIAQTAFAMHGDDAKYIAAGFDAYISKPFTKNELLSKIKELI
jgi:CheY-like chemotaxis protein